MRIQARIAWVLLAADVLAFVAICRYVDFDALGTVRGMAVMAPPIVGAVGLFTWGIASSIQAGIFARLQDSKRTVASWVIDAETWRERIATRRANAPLGPFDLPDKLPPPDGTEIVVAVDGLFVGRRYVQPLFSGPGASAEIREGWLDIEVDTEDGPVHLRLSTGRNASAQAQARKVVRHFGGPAGRPPAEASPPAGR